MGNEFMIGIDIGDFSNTICKGLLPCIFDISIAFCAAGCSLSTYARNWNSINGASSGTKSNTDVKYAWKQSFAYGIREITNINTYHELITQCRLCNGSRQSTPTSSTYCGSESKLYKHC